MPTLSSHHVSNATFLFEAKKRKKKNLGKEFKIEKHSKKENVKKGLRVVTKKRMAENNALDRHYMAFC